MCPFPEDEHLRCITARLTLDSARVLKPMIITFQLRFHTDYGQSLLLSGNRKELGDGEPDKLFRWNI